MERRCSAHVLVVNTFGIPPTTPIFDFDFASRPMPTFGGAEGNASMSDRVIFHQVFKRLRPVISIKAGLLRHWLHLSTAVGRREAPIAPAGASWSDTQFRCRLESRCALVCSTETSTRRSYDSLSL